MSLSEPRLLEIEGSQVISSYVYESYYDLQVRLIEVEVAACNAHIESLRCGGRGRHTGGLVGLSPAQAKNKKAKLLYQMLVMKADRGLLLDEMVLADSVPLNQGLPVATEEQYDCQYDPQHQQNSGSEVHEFIKEEPEALGSGQNEDERKSIQEQHQAVDWEMSETRIPDQNSSRNKSTIYHSIVFPWFEAGRLCTLAGAVELIVFRKVIIRHIRRAWKDREDVMDNRYARNRIQTSSWFNSGEKRDILATEMGKWYARRQKQWRDALVERYNAINSKGCKRCKGHRWCPVSKEYDYGWEAVHIVPYVLGKSMTDYLLGGEKSTDDHTWWRHGNGILLSDTLTRGFSSGRFVLVPVRKDAGKPDGLKLLLLNKSWTYQNSWSNWADYHDEELEFKSTHRPGRRYIFAHFVTSLLRMAMDRGQSWVEELLSDPAYYWPTAEPLMRRSMATTLLREFSCDKRLERLYEKGLFDPQHGQISEQQEQTLAQMAYINIIQDGRSWCDDIDILFFGETKEARSDWKLSECDK